MMQGAQPGALWQHRGVGWGHRWEGGSRRRTYVYLWLIYVDVWQKSTHYCKAIILQLKIKSKTYTLKILRKYEKFKNLTSV